MHHMHLGSRPAHPKNCTSRSAAHALSTLSADLEPVGWSNAWHTVKSCCQYGCFWSVPLAAAAESAAAPGIEFRRRDLNRYLRRTLLVLLQTGRSDTMPPGPTLKRGLKVFKVVDPRTVMNSTSARRNDAPFWKASPLFRAK